MLSEALSRVARELELLDAVGRTFLAHERNPDPEKAGELFERFSAATSAYLESDAVPDPDDPDEPDWSKISDSEVEARLAALDRFYPEITDDLSDPTGPAAPLFREAARRGLLEKG